MRLLDLFCGASGAAKGYHQAGFDEIVGIDIVPQPNYPFQFIQGDALNPPINLQDFDLIHASPPCQRWSWAARRWQKTYPDLIKPTRELLRGHRYVIENVPNAPLSNPILLCGSMFGLRVIRHRLFEVSPSITIFLKCKHIGTVKDGSYVTVAGHGGDSLDYRCSTWRTAMGIDWMTRYELTQAIPPAYTKFIGLHLLKWL